MAASPVKSQLHLGVTSPRNKLCLPSVKANTGLAPFPWKPSLTHLASCSCWITLHENSGEFLEDPFLKESEQIRKSYVHVVPFFTTRSFQSFRCNIEKRMVTVQIMCSSSGMQSIQFIIEFRLQFCKKLTQLISKN